MLFFTAPVSMLLHSSKSVQIEQNVFKFKIAPRKHESILNIVFANNQRPRNNLWHTPIDYQLYHYMWNCSETERLQL